ncbi:MAG TPA: glycoside hydrolase family 18 protein [Cytophagaceae bacterium]|nr:glycoside hydrolase family 18 protein [Cytophagaceae bacterium]
MKRLLPILFLVGLFTTAKAQDPSLKDTMRHQDVDVAPICKQIIGYYPSWQMYKRGGLVVPATIDYEKYTILNYSFFAPDSMANLKGTDAWADSILLRGKIDWGTSTNEYYYYYPNTSLIDIAHVWGVRVMVSIGGWTLSENFPRIAADSVKRAHFASECVRCLKEYRFDGIDIDWEYPGYTEHKGTPQDKENFTLLMQAIRDSIDAYGKKIKYRFLLTAALGANKSNMENIEWDKVKNILDYLNLMTYDYNGTWSPDANHQTALYEPREGWGGSLDGSFKLLTEKYGVGPEKINLGVAFYGRSLLMKGPGEDIYSKNHLGLQDSLTYPTDLGMPQYYDILLKMKSFERRWDDVAQAPYLIGNPGKRYTFVSYDDEQSVRLKTQYVMKKESAGVIIWDITGDYVEKSEGSGSIKNTPLANVIYDVFQPCRKRQIKKRWR